MARLEQIRLNFLAGTGGSFSFANSEAAAIVAAMVVEPTSARKLAIDNFVGALKLGAVSGIDIWSKLDLFQVYAAHSDQAARLNWKNPGVTFTAVNGTVAPQFTADRGFKGAGTNSYLDTGYDPSTGAINFAQNSGMLAAWSRTSTQESASSVGSYDGSKGVSICFRSTSNASQGRLNQAAALSGGSVSNGSGLFAVDRSASNALVIRRNAALVASGVTASTTIATGTIKVGLITGAGTPSTCEVALVIVGPSLSAGEHQDLFAAANAYMLDVGAA